MQANPTYNLYTEAEKNAFDATQKGKCRIGSRTKECEELRMYRRIRRLIIYMKHEKCRVNRQKSGAS